MTSTAQEALRDLKYFLGVEVTRSKQRIFLSQRKYVFDLLTEMGKLGAKPKNILISKEEELFHDPERYGKIS